jgi:hypothetical protein
LQLDRKNVIIVFNRLVNETGFMRWSNTVYA